MIEVTFIGTGAAFSTNQRTNVSLLVREGDVNFLIECGPAVLFQLDRAGSAANQVTHVFISHRHGDHILGLPMFLLAYALGGAPKSLDNPNEMPKPLTVLGSQDVIQVARQLTNTVYPELAKRRLDNVTWQPLPADQPSSVQVGPSLSLSTLPTQHSEHAPVLALRLDFHASGRSLVYTGDTTYNEALGTFAAGCDLLVHESNYSATLQPYLPAGRYGGHSTARQAGHVATLAGCGILSLVHLSPNYAGDEARVQAEAAQAFDGTIIIPKDGATLYL